MRETYRDLKDVPAKLRDRVADLAYRSKFNLIYCTILYDPEADNLSLINYDAPTFSGDCGSTE